MRSLSKTSRGQRRTWGLGCGYFLLVGISACILLVLNSAVVWAVYQAVMPTNSELMASEKFLQAVMFSVPVLLIFVEYAVYDLVVDLLTARRN